MKEHSSRPISKKSHRFVWDPTQTKLDLGLIGESWANFMRQTHALADRIVNEQQAEKFFTDVFARASKAAITKAGSDELKRGIAQRVSKLMEFYSHGSGAEMSHGTAWGLLNAVTEMYTHGSGRREASHQFWDAYYGAGDNVKTTAFELLTTT